MLSNYVTVLDNQRQCSAIPKRILKKVHILQTCPQSCYHPIQSLYANRFENGTEKYSGQHILNIISKNAVAFIGWKNG